jgi:cohesin loading factor subunit SCC2
MNSIEHLSPKSSSSIAGTISSSVGNSPSNKSSSKQKTNTNESGTSSSKRNERSSAVKSGLLGTWQANLTSQLLLPADFTPELIQQLAAEGYDVVSAAATAGRKPRNRANTQQTAMLNSIMDSSDEEAGGDEDYKKQHQKHTRNLNNEDGSTSGKSNKSRNLDRLDRTALTKIDFGSDPTENPSFKRFNQLLDEIFDSFENDMQQQLSLMSRVTGERDAEIPAECLLTRQMCSDLVQEAFKLNNYSIMNVMRKESLAKLQTLLFFNIKDCMRSLNLLNDEAFANNEHDKLLKELLIEKLFRASDCSIISLIIMTSPNIAKELVIEDIVEQVTVFVKVQLNSNIFPHYDPVYKTADSATNTNQSASSKRKLLNQFNSTGSSSSSANKYMHHLYNRMREILHLLSELVNQIDLTDTIIITLSSLSVMCFFVENINDLQLETLKILTNIYTRYSKHRQLILDDILSSLVKLHASKRNARSYKCYSGDSIQMFSALILQLIQCEVTSVEYAQSQNSDMINDMATVSEKATNGQSIADDQHQLQRPQQTNQDVDSSKAKSELALSFEEKESYIMTTYENSSQTAKKFLSVFFSKCKTKQADSDFRPIFENFIQDLLITVNKPEWPVSELILNLLGIILCNQIQNEQNDVGSRVNSLEYLGQIVSQLRKDSLEYQKYPDKVQQVLSKLLNRQIGGTVGGIATRSSSAGFVPSEEDLFRLQKSLIDFLNSLASNDSSLQFAKYFLVGQWLKELNQQTQSDQQNQQQQSDESNTLEYGQERMQKHMAAESNRKHVYQLIETNGIGVSGTSDSRIDVSSSSANKENVKSSLDMNEAFILSKYLCSMKKTLDKNFDYYLLNILSLSGGASEAITPTQVRSKAIKCLSLIIEADPQILLKQKVFACVEANFLHQTISVREASVDLVGRFITLKPELTNQYYKLLSDRILDVGVSVRKRVIKIFRDICLNQPEFEHMAEICVKVLRRLNDEEGIRKLVVDTFYNIWFAPITSTSSNISGPSKEQLIRRALNMVDVVSEFNALSSNQQSTEIFEQLFNSLVANPTNQSSTGGLAFKEEHDAATLGNI